METTTPRRRNGGRDQSANKNTDSKSKVVEERRRNKGNDDDEIDEQKRRLHSNIRNDVGGEPAPSSFERKAASFLMILAMTVLTTLLFHTIDVPVPGALDAFLGGGVSAAAITADSSSADSTKNSKLSTKTCTEPESQTCTPDSHHRLITTAELAANVGENGASPTNPIWLAVLGNVYDVTTGEQFYKHGQGGYSMFAGRDASPCFATGNFTLEGVEEPIGDLEGKKLVAIIDWAEFYETHETYGYLGILAGGIFYDEEGEERELRREVVRKAKDAKVIMASEQNAKRKIRMDKRKEKERLEQLEKQKKK